MSASQPLEAQIRAVLQEHGRLNKPVGDIGSDSDLYLVGMTSHASVNVMLALEGSFDVEFPDHMLKRSVFSSIATIGKALAELERAKSMR